MRKPNKNLYSTGAPTYPDKTTGSEAASSIRKQANKWSEETRAKLFEEGMQIIYGGPSPSTAKIRS